MTQLTTKELIEILRNTEVKPLTRQEISIGECFAVFGYFIGKTVEECDSYLMDELNDLKDYSIRVISEDGKYREITTGVSYHRINVMVVDGKVSDFDGIY